MESVKRGKIFVGGILKKSKMNEVARKDTSGSATVAANKSGHDISKSCSAAKYEGRTSSQNSKRKIIPVPTFRVVYVYEPETIITDPQNFRSLVQKLTGKPPHKSKEKKRQTNPSGPSSEVVCAKVGTENVQHIFYSNDQMPVVENESTNFSIEESSGLSKAFDDTDMIVPCLVSHGLLHNNTLVCNNDQHLFYSNNEMPIMEGKSTNFLIEDCCGFSELFNDTDMIFSGLVNQELLNENPLIWNNSLFCNTYDGTGACDGLEGW